MKHSIIFNNTKGFVSVFSALDAALKNGSDTRLKKHLLKLRTSDNRDNSKIVSTISR